MDFLTKINNNSLLVTNNNDKLEILNYLSNNSLFLNLYFYDPNHAFLQFDKSYHYYLNQSFGYDPNVSDRMKKYFDYIDIKESYDNAKIRDLQTIKKQLMNDKILVQGNQVFQQIFSINGVFVPSFLKGNVTKVSTSSVSKEDISLFKTANPKEQAYAVFEKVVVLLSSGVNLNQINILNTKNEDDLELTKLFKDAKIPYNLAKPVKVAAYPLFLELIKVLKNQGYESAVSFIQEQEQSPIVKKIITVFNKYPSKLIKNNLEVFIYELKKLTIVESGLNNAITISNFQDFIYQKEQYYLLLNYYDDYFPKKYLDNDYLSDFEADLINYPTSLIKNRITEENITIQLNQMDNLMIFYPERIIEDTIKCQLKLDRRINEFDYSYQTEAITYLQDLVFLDYAKKRYDYLNYNLATEDYPLLNTTFSELYYEYIPYFSGISQQSIKRLINKNNTLTAYKLESFYLCPFQYFLKYLLKLDNFEENIFSYLGNVIHRAIESKSKSGSFDFHQIIQEFSFPEKELAKFEIYQEILKENIDVVLEMISDLEENTFFKTVQSEKTISHAINDQFRLTGIIDKVMIDEEKKQFLVIDYKYGDKDFKREDLRKNYKLQLPLYLYAFTQANPDFKPIGMFYQQTALTKQARGENDGLKMKGMFIDRVDVMRRVDPTISKIQGFSILANQSLKDSKNNILSETEIQDLLNDCELRVKVAAEKINHADFEIKPVLSKGSSLSKNSIACDYCSFGSICYSKNKILGGDL